MIFAPDLVEKILAGAKTVTRRPHTGANPTRERGGWIDDPCRYKPVWRIEFELLRDANA